MTALGTHALTRADIRKIEEALDTNDLEFMVAAVDQIVLRRLAKALNMSVAELVKRMGVS